MRDIREIKLVDLLVDQKNYRLRPQANQRDAIRAMIVDQKRKLTVLARDILEHGLSPGELLLAAESTDQKGRFVVYEGNRRVTALKVMESPELASGLPTDAIFRRLGDLFKEKPIRTVEVSVVPDREIAMFWIERRHTRGHDGAGVEDWGPMAQDRYGRDHDNPARRSIMAMDILDDGSDEWQRVSSRLEGRTTTVDRVFDMPYFQEALGVIFDPMEVTITYANGDLNAGELLLRRIMTAMADPLFKFEQIEDKGDRVSFIDSFRPWSVANQAPDQSNSVTSSSPNLAGDETASDNPTGSPASPQPSEGGSADSENGSNPTSASPDEPAGGGRPKPPRKDPLIRETLAPSKSPYILRVEGLRLTKLYEECKTVKVDKNRNAAALLTRVFLELSTDHFIANKNLALPAGAEKNGKGWKDVHLQQKVEAVVRALDPKTLDKGLDFARSAGGSGHLHGYQTLHRYVHGLEYVPDPKELKDTWVRWHPYLDRLYATLNPK